MVIKEGENKTRCKMNSRSLASFPGSPPLARNYCVTFELVLAFLHEFKGHAIIARKGGGAWERG